MKKILVYTLLFLSFLHLAIMLYYAVTSEHAYILANFPPSLYTLMLLHAPLVLNILPLSLFLFDRFVHKETNWPLFFSAFIVNFSLALFVVGSILFGGH